MCSPQGQLRFGPGDSVSKYNFEKFSLHLFSCQKGPEHGGSWRKERTKLGPVIMIMTLMSRDDTADSELSSY